MWNISISQKEYLILQNQIRNILLKSRGTTNYHTCKMTAHQGQWSSSDMPKTAKITFSEESRATLQRVLYVQKNKSRQTTPNLLSKHVLSAPNGYMSQRTWIYFGQTNKNSPGGRTTRHLMALYKKAFMFYFSHSWWNTDTISLALSSTSNHPYHQEFANSYLKIQ